MNELDSSRNGGMRIYSFVHTYTSSTCYCVLLLHLLVLTSIRPILALPSPSHPYHMFPYLFGSTEALSDSSASCYRQFGNNETIVDGVAYALEERHVESLHHRPRLPPRCHITLMSLNMVKSATCQTYQLWSLPCADPNQDLGELVLRRHLIDN